MHDAFGAPRRGRWLSLPDGTAVVEAAAAVPLDPARLDPLAASSRGFGELVAAALGRRREGSSARPRRDGDDGRGRRLPRSRRRAAGSRAGRVRRDGDAGSRRRRVFGPQKGAGPAEIAELERRFAAREELVLVQHKPGSGRCGRARGGARVARRRARSRAPSSCSTRSGSTPRASISSSPARGGSTPRPRLERRLERSYAVAARHALRRLRRRSSSADVPGAETVALSGDPARARDDLDRARTRLSVEPTLSQRASASRSRCASAWTSFHAIRASVSTIGRNSQNVIA